MRYLTFCCSSPRARLLTDSRVQARMPGRYDLIIRAKAFMGSRRGQRTRYGRTLPQPLHRNRRPQPVDVGDDHVRLLPHPHHPMGLEAQALPDTRLL